MRRQYLSAPLPFQGQKRMFAKEFIKVLKHYPDDAVFVDLFGGSGLLSHGNVRSIIFGLNDACVLTGWWE